MDYTMVFLRITLRAIFILFITSSLTYADNLSIITPAADGSYAINARLFSRYLSNSLPDHPTIIIQEMPGAQSLVAANYLYNVAPRDGSVIATLYKEVSFVGLMGGDNIHFDASKYTVLGSTADGRKDTIILWSRENQLHKGLIVGVEGATIGNMATFVDKLLNANFHYVSGYPSAGQNRLAMDRGEVNTVIYSLSGIKTQKPDWLNNNDIHPLLQFSNGKARHKEYLNVPTLAELIDEKDIDLLNAYEGQFVLLRPFFAPPNISKRKAEELQKAFIEAANNLEYKREAAAANIDVNPIDSAEALRILTTYNSDQINNLRAIYNEHN
jgi:tripartite-type tricarboxylate transporter receptor subunit TctC